MHFSTILSSTLLGGALAIQSGHLPFGQLDSLAFQSTQSGLRARDLEDLAEENFNLYAREARGGGGHTSSRPSASSIAHGISDGAGNIGTALTGITNFANLFRSNHQKRDLEDLENFGLEIVARDIEDGSIYVRAMRGGGGSSGSSRRPSLSQIGHGVNTALNGAGNIGTALTGVSDFVNLFKGGKRDLAGLEYELLAREEELDFE